MTAILTSNLQVQPQKVRRFSRFWLYLPALLALSIFLGIPLFENASRSIGISNIDHSSVLTWDYYAKLFGDAYYRGVIVETLKVSVITTLWCLLLGYPVAYFMVRRSGRLAVPLLFVLVTPLLTSIIMRTFGWNVLLARQGLVNSVLLNIGLIDKPLSMLGSSAIVYIGMIHVMVPFMVLSIIPVLRAVDLRLEESARILGAGPWRTFFNITLPLSIEGIVTGCILVFMVTNGSFVSMLLLGQGSVVTLPLLIFQQFSQTQDFGFASAMGNLLLFIVLFCLYMQARYASRKGALQ